MSRSKLQRVMGGVAAGVLATGVLVVAPAGTASAESEAHICSGVLPPGQPGVLTGTIHGDVIVKGLCIVDAGSATVDGDLTVSPGGVLGATFGNDDLTITGDLRVGTGAAAFLGCSPLESTCFGDTTGTLSAHVHVWGDVTSSKALAVQMHNDTVGGDVTQRGGGGGVNCDVPPTGVFNFLGSPVFSAYEDTAIRGDVRVSRVMSCWLGLARDTVGGDMVVTNNQFADPDAVEIISNTIHGDLVCRGNSMAWDSVDQPPDFNLYPRAWHPNTVHGDRRGQCVKAPPLTLGGTSPGVF